MTEPQESDSGTSVTNACETIATDLLNSEYLNEVNPENVIWIEHYERRSSYPETFDVIEFCIDDENRILSNPEWTHFGSSLDDEDIIDLLER